MAYNPPGSSVQGIFQARTLEWAAISFFRGLPDPGFEHMSPAWQADSLPLSHQGRPGVYKTRTVVEEHIHEPAETRDRYAETSGEGLQVALKRVRIRSTPHRPRTGNEPLQCITFPYRMDEHPVLKAVVQGMTWESASETVNLCRLYGEQITNMHHNLKCKHSSHHCCLFISSHGIFLS